MPSLPVSTAAEIKTLATGQDCATVAVFVEGLCNTVLVQAFRHQMLPPTLYVVYREADMTFDAIGTLQLADARAPLDDVLRAFIASDSFQAQFVGAIRTEIDRYFRKPIPH